METRGLQRSFKAGNRSNRRALDGIYYGRSTRCRLRFMEHEAEEERRAFLKAEREAEAAKNRERLRAQFAAPNGQQPGMIRRAFNFCKRIFTGE